MGPRQAAVALCLVVGGDPSVGLAEQAAVQEEAARGPDAGASSESADKASGADCLAVTGDGRTFPICFDPGNRLSVAVDTANLGASLELRHVVATDDTDVHWRLEHRAAAELALDDLATYRATLYRGRYLRHSRDGHIVLPIGKPRKLFIPFDLGAETEIGQITGQFGGSTLQVGVVRGVLLVELTRAANFRRRVAVGAVARWDAALDLDARSIAEHVVTPFTAGMLDLHAETRDGLLVASLRLEGGGGWSSVLGWKPDFRTEAAIERIVLAINDRPLSLYATGGYHRLTDAWSGAIGVRWALVR